MRSLKSNNFLKNFFGANKYQKKLNSISSKKFNLLIGKNKIKILNKNIFKREKK
jgi:hypothetical protein